MDWMQCLTEIITKVFGLSKWKDSCYSLIWERRQVEQLDVYQTHPQGGILSRWAGYRSLSWEQKVWTRKASAYKLYLQSRIRLITKKLIQISFSNTTLLSFGIRTFCCGGCSMHCRMFSSIPGLYSLDISSTPHTHTHSCDNQKHPLLGTTV